MNARFQAMASGCELPPYAATQLLLQGFTTVAGPYTGEQVSQVTAAYDRLMGRTTGSSFKAGSATTRTFDVLNHGSAFDGVFLHPPLLEACWQVIGEPFKLSSLVARTLRPGAVAQELHADLPRDSQDEPMVGFILMIDSFRQHNGATRFVPGSHVWSDLPADRLADIREIHAGEMLAVGEAGSMILFNAAVWHGHTANGSCSPRRSLQGYFVRQSARSTINFSEQLAPATQARLTPFAQHLLALG